MLVHFNGSYVESIDGLKLGSKKGIKISITKTELDGLEVYNYRGAAADLGKVYCEPPSEVTSEGALKSDVMDIVEIRQNCSVADKGVDQSILLNQYRQLVSLQFVLHPAHEPATIRYNPS